MELLGMVTSQFAGPKFLESEKGHVNWVNFITTSRRSPEAWKSWLIKGIIPKWPNYSG
jgi:hypothetical protein